MTKQVKGWEQRFDRDFKNTAVVNISGDDSSGIFTKKLKSFIRQAIRSAQAEARKEFIEKLKKILRPSNLDWATIAWEDYNELLKQYNDEESDEK